MNPLEITLGIMTAVGGFVDISELVFAAKAGSIFGYALIWVFALATIGIMVFGEMSGRVAAVARQPDRPHTPCGPVARDSHDTARVLVQHG